MNTDITAVCPECEEPMPLPQGTIVGEILPCASCATELEVISLDPPSVARAPEVEEDWGE